MKNKPTPKPAPRRPSKPSRFTARQIKILDRAEKIIADKKKEVEIMRAKPLSKQPRFNKAQQSEFFTSVYRWAKDADLSIHPYSSRSMRRDKELSTFWQREPHFAGVLNSVVSIDKNRGWSLTGGRNQVNRYTAILHSFSVAPDLQGWRPGTSAGSQSFYTTDLGFVGELGRQGRGGPFRRLYHTDSARCVLTGRSDFSLRYHPATGKPLRWEPADYIRVVSMPSTDEVFFGLGFCATSRAIEMTKILIAVYLHNQEMLAARAPRGLLLLKGLQKHQWEDAMAAREEALDEKEQKYYGSLAVLASMGVDDIDAKMFALSQLPANFSQDMFTNLTMYCYALCFGYDPREFWPVSSGSLGTATESEVQARKATGKGGLDFALGFQEQLQRPDVLPATLHYEIDQRDAAGEMEDAVLAKAQGDVITSLYESGLKENASLIDREEARILLAESGLIPAEWTEKEEDVTATDMEDVTDSEVPAETGTARGRLMRDKILSNDRVVRAIAEFPHEPIVKYHWQGGHSTLRTIWQRGEDARRRMWRVESHPSVYLSIRVPEQTERADVLGQWNDTVIDAKAVAKAVAKFGKRISPEMGVAIARHQHPVISDNFERDIAKTMMIEAS